MSTSVQPKETNPEGRTLGIFGQKVVEPQKTETIQDIAREIRTALKTREERWSKEDHRSANYWSNRTPPATQLELDFRHSFWHTDREKIKQAFVDLNITASRQDRFCECGSTARVLVSEDGKEAKITSNKCHDRFCKACGGEKQRLIQQNVLQYCENKTLRFVTLTLKHNNETLARQIDRLYTAFDRMRERKAWKTRVKGGVVFFEFKPAKDRREWHPHLHIIMESDFIPQNLLSSEWLVCTGDSRIVDIRFVHDKHASISYVAKYACKPIDGSLYHRPDMLREAIQCLEGRRAATVFGAWRRTKSNPTGLQLNEQPEDNGVWVDVGSLAEVIANAQAGDTQARNLCRKLGLDGGCTPPEHHPPPKQNPDEIPF